MRRDLLIVEDLMLLLLDDKSGALKGAGTIHYSLGGAVLMELALLGRVEVDRKQSVHAVPGDPLGDPLLDSAAAQAAKRPRYVQTSLMEIGANLHAQVLDRLVERGFIRRERSKMLGFIPSTKMPAQNPAYEAELLERMRAVFEDGVKPDARTGVLAAMLAASGTLPEFHPAIRWSGKIAVRARELQESDWGSAAVNNAIVQVANAGVAVGVATAVGVIGNN
ncbi:GPP34 family phosphoprotein [Amycolatopsis antarctica]|uniref:GPP34 family phosphoprotein n=1 Tax=Amycolatopsis antarctica TaxID=1854586 RepID=A0A263CY17_9PSEU|nr:GPP34 family phosphoprotein [Amycolatopsis antarctica]OZM69995.1 GPP34 family phosphoprotein [Amycolatopsis antarctica]